MKRLEYEEAEPQTREEVTERLRTGSNEAVARLLIGIGLYEDDFQFALTSVLSCVAAENANVRGNAVLCLGHIARVHSEMPVACVEIINRALTDADDFVRGQAMCAAQDVGQFIPALRPLLAVSRWTWGATLEVVAGAPAPWSPGRRGEVVGARVVETDAEAARFDAAIGSTVCSLESEDEEILDVPERWLVVVP